MSENKTTDEKIASLKEGTETMSETLQNAKQSLEDLESKGMGDSPVANRIRGLVKALKAKEDGMAHSIMVLEKGREKLEAAKKQEKAEKEEEANKNESKHITFNESVREVLPQ